MSRATVLGSLAGCLSRGIFSPTQVNGCKGRLIVALNPQPPRMWETALDLRAKIPSVVTKLDSGKPQHALLLRLQSLPCVSQSNETRAVLPMSPTVDGRTRDCLRARGRGD